MITPKTYRKNKLAKALVFVTFLLGVFSFSGYVGNSQIRQRPVAQTELVFSRQSKIKHYVRFHKAFEAQGLSTSFASKGYETNRLSSFNIRIKVVFAHLARRFSSTKSVARFYRANTIPQTSGEDGFISFLG